MQPSKNRKEFVAHTRATLKDLAENLNFRSWNAANTLNIYFNQYVLNNPEFNKAVLNTFMQKVMQSVKPVEAGSELAEMGYQMYGTVDLHDFNYRFTMNADHTGFDVEEADNLEVILNAWNPATQQVEAGLYKVTLKAGGIHHLDLSQFASSASILDVMAVVLSSRSIDEAKLTLLDDLTTTISISDMPEALQVAREGAAARCNHRSKNLQKSDTNLI